MSQMEKGSGRPNRLSPGKLEGSIVPHFLFSSPPRPSCYLPSILTIHNQLSCSLLPFVSASRPE
jgi:hypothetical protein